MENLTKLLEEAGSSLIILAVCVLLLSCCVIYGLARIL